MQEQLPELSIAQVMPGIKPKIPQRGDLDVWLEQNGDKGGS